MTETQSYFSGAWHGSENWALLKEVATGQCCSFKYFLWIGLDSAIFAVCSNFSAFQESPFFIIYLDSKKLC